MDLWGEAVLSSNQESDEVNPKQSEFSPYKPNEYRLYMVWKALPINAINCERIAEEVTIDQCEVEQLIGIKTQSDFAKRFGLHQSTLTEWNNQPIPSEYAHLDWRTWAKTLTKDVVFALYEGIMDYGDPARVRLWFQFIDPDSAKPNQTSTDENEGKYLSIADLMLAASKYTD